MTEASRDAAAKKCDPPRLDLGKIDLKKPPSKALLAAECETRGLPVKRKGDAPDGEPTELVKALVQRLREHHDGADLIDQLTPYATGAKRSKWEGGATLAWITSAASPPRSLPSLSAKAPALPADSSVAQLPTPLVLPPIAEAAARALD